MTKRVSHGAPGSICLRVSPISCCRAAKWRKPGGAWPLSAQTTACVSGVDAVLTRPRSLGRHHGPWEIRKVCRPRENQQTHRVNSAVKLLGKFPCLFVCLKRFTFSKAPGAAVRGADEHSGWACVALQSGCESRRFQLPILEVAVRGRPAEPRWVVPDHEGGARPSGATRLSAQGPTCVQGQTGCSPALSRPPRRSPQAAWDSTPALCLRLQGPFYPREVQDS